MDLDEHSCDDTQTGAASDGDSRFRDRTSEVWDEYKPVSVNGVQKAECRHCHAHLVCRLSNLHQHRIVCRGKQGPSLSQKQQNAELRYVLVNEIDPLEQILPDTHDDLNLASHSEKKGIWSKVWKNFTPVYVEGKIQAADCVHCHKRLTAHNGRSHLKRHTQACLPRHQKSVLSHSSVSSLKSRLQDELSPALTNGKVHISESASKFLKGSSGDRTPVDQHSPAVDKMDCTEQNTSSDQIASDTCRKFDQEASYLELTRMIILHGYPLSIVEHEEMRRFTKSLNSAFNLASSIDIEEYSTLLFQKEKADLKEKIALSSHRVSLSASLWAPHGPDAAVKYLCLAVHFIDSDWKLKRRIIKFDVFQPSATYLDSMIHFKTTCVPDFESGPLNVIEEAINDWSLDQKLFSLTSVSEIKDECTSKLKDFLMRRKCLPIELYNIACVDGVLNNIASKGQPMLHLVGDILERFIKAQKSSLLTQQQLKEVITNTELKCPEEDSKKWHKIYFGLEVLLHFKKSFPSEELLPAEDTKTVESVYKIFRAFHRAIEVISGAVTPTANIYFNELWKIRTTLHEEASTVHTELANMVSEMQEAFNEYWNNSYVWLSVPVVLDPRFKFAFIEFRFRQAYGSDSVKYVSGIRATIRELFLEYCSSVDKPAVGSSNRIRIACDVEVDGFDSDPLEDWDEHLNVQARSKLLTELDNYLEDGLVPREGDFDILNWWMSNSIKYPTLSIMARDTLAVPASAVHCEAALRSKGPVIHKQWSTLNIKTIEALVCTRDWIK